MNKSCLKLGYMTGPIYSGLSIQFKYPLTNNSHYICQQGT